MKYYILFSFLFLFLGCSNYNREKVIQEKYTDNFSMLKKNECPDTLSIILGVRSFESPELLSYKTYPGYIIKRKRYLFQSDSFFPFYREAFYEIELLKIK